MRLINLAMEGGAPVELVLNTKDDCGAEKTYTRAFLPPCRLILLGGGHVSQPLCRYAADLEFGVTVVDDRPSFANAARFPDAEHIVCDSFVKAISELAITPYDYVCVITRGHRYDAVCLRQIFAGVMPRYLGLIGSKRRTIELFHMLEEEGFGRALIDRVHTPIGLPIGAETPKEIAISILAELIQQRSSRSAEREAERLALASHEAELLQYLLSNREPCVLAVVVERREPRHREVLGDREGHRLRRQQRKGHRAEVVLEVAEEGVAHRLAVAYAPRHDRSGDLAERGRTPRSTSAVGDAIAARL